MLAMTIFKNRTRAEYKRILDRRRRELARRHARRWRPWFEQLEERLAPATINLINASGGDWDSAGNWDLGRVPTSTDDAFINISGISISHSTSASDEVNSLTGLGSLAISAGTLSVATSSTVT